MRPSKCFFVCFAHVEEIHFLGDVGLLKGNLEWVRMEFEVNTLGEENSWKPKSVSYFFESWIDF